jgi:hypothetical protein
MDKTMQTKVTRAGVKKPQNESAKTSAAVRGDDDWDGELGDSGETGVEWLEMTAREKDTSRIRRQMEARRALERRLEEKRLRDLVEDWAF